MPASPLVPATPPTWAPAAPAPAAPTVVAPAVPVDRPASFEFPQPASRITKDVKTNEPALNAGSLEVMQSPGAISARRKSEFCTARRARGASPTANVRHETRGSAQCDPAWRHLHEIHSTSSSARPARPELGHDDGARRRSG